MMLNWERGFKAHHLNATLKYTQDSYIKTQDLGDDLKMVSTDVIKDWQGELRITGTIDIS